MWHRPFVIPVPEIRNLSVPKVRGSTAGAYNIKLIFLSLVAKCGITISNSGWQLLGQIADLWHRGVTNGLCHIAGIYDEYVGLHVMSGAITGRKLLCYQDGHYNNFLTIHTLDAIWVLFCMYARSWTSDLRHGHARMNMHARIER